MTFAILTNTGRNKEAAAIAEGIALTITEMAWGDGKHVPAGGELALENEQGRKPVQASGTVPNTPNTAFFEILLDETEGPFVIREAGLFDADGDMVAVAHYDPPVNKPLNHVSALIRINILFSDLENLILKVQSTDAYVPAERILTAGTGLLGGGDLSEDRSFAADFATEDQALAGTREDKVMSPALVSATINALVAGAPDALDTLNELAAALGDDPNFSATILAELNKLKTPVVTAIVDDAALDAVNATSIWTAAQGVLNPPLAIGGTIEHTELSDGSAIQKAYRITPDGVFLTKHICTRRTGTWSGWTADGPDIGDLVIQTHGGDLLDRLEANGAVMNRTSYADLFWRTGTTYGAGDGATTFGTLDARGEFLRGWDNGRGVDAGRSLGSYQPGTKTVGERGDTVSTNAHTVHDVGNIHADPVYETNFDTCIQYDGETSNIYLSSSSVWWMTVRPRNIAQMFCIKF